MSSLLRRGLGSLALACLLSAPALADTIAPTVSLVVDGIAVSTIPLEPDPATGGWIVENYEWKNTSVGQVDIYSLLLDPDPQIVYAAAVIDFGSASTFGFSFGTPIVSTGAPGVVTHSHSSSTTNGGGVAGTPVTAVAPPSGIPVDGDLTPEIAVYTLSQDGGATFLNAGLDASPSFVGASPSGVQGPFNLGPIAGPAGSGSYNFMRIDLNFSMTGGNDAYTFNGIATVIPEPTSLALLGFGIAGVAFVGRRR